MATFDMNYYKKIPKIRYILGFILLFFYSISPGISKVFNSGFFYSLGLLFAILFVVLAPRDLLLNKSLQLNGSFAKNIFISLIIVFLLSNLIGIIFGEYSYRASIIGIGTFFVPFCLGYVLSGRNAYFVFKLIAMVGLVNCLIAFVIYPPIQSIFPAIINDYSIAILEGNAAFRLSSVSGSLAFGTLTLISLVSWMHLYDLKKTVYLSVTELRYHWIFLGIIVLSALLSLQRSAWLGVSIYFLLRYIHKFPIRIILALFVTSVSLGLFPSLLTSIGFENSDIFHELLVERFKSMFFSEGDSAVGERAGQWLYVIDNLFSYPLGVGFGQAGQATRIADIESDLNAIVDGDYFRILSEFGLLSLPLVFLIILGPLRIFFIRIKSNSSKFFSKSISLLLFLISIQLIGTNVTEMYFVNTCFWFVFFCVYRLRSDQI